MIESIEFREGVFSLVVSAASTPGTAESECRIQFDFGESGTVSKAHRSEFMDRMYSIYPEGAHQICNLIFELLSTHTRIRRVHFYCFYRADEPLEGSRSTDEQIQFAGAAIESTGSEEDIPF